MRGCQLDGACATQVWCLNEAMEGSAQGVFRAWDKRLEAPETPLESNDDDPELLLHVPFDGAAKVKALCIIGATQFGLVSRRDMNTCLWPAILLYTFLLTCLRTNDACAP